MASLSETNFAFISSLLLVSTSMAAVSASSFQFQVGGERGWIIPSGNETETYDEWAERTRFHVGDSLYFKYYDDSVLVVNSTDYASCILSNPITQFKDGNTIFLFERYGFFYFISGQPGHCKAGQKVIIRVMVHPRVEPPASAPSPGGSGGGEGLSPGQWGPPSLSSSMKLSVASYFTTALGGLLVILYLVL